MGKRRRRCDRHHRLSLRSQRSKCYLTGREPCLSVTSWVRCAETIGSPNPSGRDGRGFEDCRREPRLAAVLEELLRYGEEGDFAHCPALAALFSTAGRARPTTASDRSAHRAAPRLSACAIGLPPSLAGAHVLQIAARVRDAIAHVAGPDAEQSHNRDIRRWRAAGNGVGRRQCVPVRNRGRGSRSRDRLCVRNFSPERMKCRAEAIPPDPAVARILLTLRLARPPAAPVRRRIDAVGAHRPSCERKCGRQPRRTAAVAWPDGAKRRFACPCGADAHRRCATALAGGPAMPCARCGDRIAAPRGNCAGSRRSALSGRSGTAGAIAA